MTPLVLKLGGSLAEAGRLAGVLGIVGRARRALVVVPGGGPFADAVRGAQERDGFSDATAHRLAILAMEQMALLMAALEPRLAPEDGLDAMRGAAPGGVIPVWMPSRLCEDDDLIPRDWSITSDGLAARLAERLGGAPVALVKAARVAAGASLEQLAETGVVDATFPVIVARAGLSWRVIGAEDEAGIARLVEAAPAAARRSG